MAQPTRNPNLMNPKTMEAVAGTRGISESVVLFSEVLTKVNNAKDKPKKVAVLKEYDKLKEQTNYITDPSLIAIIDKMEELTRALRRHIVRKF